MSTLEKHIEQKLVQAVKRKGGMALKFVSPNVRGVPDRLVLMPDGKMSFVEVKQKGKKPRPTQELMIRKIEALGFHVYVLDDVKSIKDILDSMEV